MRQCFFLFLNQLLSPCAGRQSTQIKYFAQLLFQNSFSPEERVGGIKITPRQGEKRSDTLQHQFFKLHIAWYFQVHSIAPGLQGSGKKKQKVVLCLPDGSRHIWPSSGRHRRDNSRYISMYAVCNVIFKILLSKL